MRRSWVHSVMCAWTTCAVLLSGCPAPTKVVQKPARPVPYATGQPVTAPSAGRPTTAIVDKEEGALTTSLGAGSVAATNAPVTVLTEQETQALLARAEPLPKLDNANAPALRPPSAPPPKSGPTEPIAFVAQTGKVIADKPVSPAADKPAGTVAMTPPQILPVGDVQAESEIRVRFTEPMVAVAAVGESKAAIATITPPVAGTWRWVDTRVAMFQAAGKRLPMATEFTVTVPAGTKAISGAVLPTDVSEKFQTPGVRIVGTYPTTTLRPDSAVLVRFDQEIDPTAIVKYLRVEGPRNRKLGFKAITLADAQKRWARNPVAAADTSSYGTSYVIIAPTGAWPAGETSQVVLAKNAPSKEGTRVTSYETGADFHVAPAFTVRGIECYGTGDEKLRLTGSACPANSFLSVRFSNDIEPTTYRSKKIQIAGEPFYDHQIEGDGVTLESPVRAGGTHTISIGDGIQDIYAQPLVGSRELSFRSVREVYVPELNAHSGLYVLDPRFEIPQWVVRTQAIGSLSIELYQVTPADYFAYQAFEQGKSKKLPGKRVYQKEHVVGARHAADVRVDLTPALPNGTGHVIAIATAKPTTGVQGKLENTVERAWIQVSKLGLTARFDGERAHVWAHDITPARFLQPLSGVETALVVQGRTDVPKPVTGDANGHASFELMPRQESTTTAQRNEYPTAMLTAKLGNDTAFASIGGRFERYVRHENARWYVTDDRFTYKPGEPVYVKGWVRWTHDGVNPDLSVPASGDSVTWSLTDSRGNRVANGTASFTAQGGFDITANLPPNVNLGTAVFDLRTKSSSMRHAISVEEFRTPAFGVTLADDVQFSATRPLILGERIQMSAEAKYYAGGGLPGADVNWAVRLTSASYEPPGWDRYDFDPVEKRSERFYSWRRRGRGSSERVDVSEDGTLTGASTSAIDIGISALPLKKPSVLQVDATVVDIDRQRIRAESRKILVHPAELYVGTRLNPENHGELQLVVTDLDGNLVPNVTVDVALEAVLGSERERDDAEVVDTQSCKVTSSAKAPVTCAFKHKDHKYAYTSLATIKDSAGRVNVSQYDIPWWTWADQDLTVTADRQIYRPGDVAKISIVSKRQPAAAIVSFARNGVIEQKRVTIPATGATVELPIKASYIENIKVLVDRVTVRRLSGNEKEPRTMLPLPDSDAAEIDLAVDESAARLTMRTRPLQTLVEPGAEASFEVEVKHEDKPVKGAEVALIVVDEAVLAISGKMHADPLEPFFDKVDDGTWQWDNLDMFENAGSDILGKPGFDRIALDEPGRKGWGFGRSGYGSGGGAMGGRSMAVPSVRVGSAQVVRARKDFRATAVFSPKLETDANGKARVTVKMPDNLTRYRIVALATHDTRNFGKAESNIVAQLKVNARTVAPRFLTQGDTFSVPVVVQNLDAAPRTIDVAVRAANLLATGPQGKRVVVPGGERAEVRFDFATQTRGKAVVQTIASSGTFADSSNVEIPVYEPATTESFATYGNVTDKTAFEQLRIPTDVFADVGGVEAEISSTQLQNLTDAYWYLYAYPFECAEQRSSRMIATTTMADILEAFSVGVRPSKKEILEQRAFDVKKLTRDQKGDGGWGYFRDMESDAFVTMQVLTALGLQGDKSGATKNATVYVTRQFTTLLTNLEKQVKARTVKQTKGADAANVSLAAAALSALAATGADVAPHAVKLHAAATALGNYPVDAKARLLAIVATKPAHKAMREKLLADLLSATHETAAAATVTTSFSDEESRMLLVSNHKTTALTLDAILREQPQQALVTKLARGLLDGRKRGRWISTQENVVVLQAMRRYFDIYEKDTPNFTGKLWLGNEAYAEYTFSGRTTARAATFASWAALKPGSTHDIAIDRSGTGRMYWRLGITYAPRATNLPPLDAGFIVRRTYTPIDNPSDAVQQPDGTWKVKLGARLLVQIETLNTSARHAVAVVDPLPAGFESVNTRLKTSERAAIDVEADRWDHTMMRDNRSEAFTMHLPEGAHRFSYTVRATTPGTFIAAPAKAEEMYNPETFGRSSGTKVIVQ